MCSVVCLFVCVAFDTASMYWLGGINNYDALQQENPMQAYAMHYHLNFSPLPCPLSWFLSNLHASHSLLCHHATYVQNPVSMHNLRLETNTNM